MIITIDGPSGSGKSTVAKLLAQKLKFVFFDTGAMYRAVTYLILKSKCDFNDEATIKKILKDLKYEIKTDGDGDKTYIVNGEDVTLKIRSHEVTTAVSEISKKEYIRFAVVKMQRSFATHNAVFEGRDMGTVVFPYADVKFFLTASTAIRADRRYSELLEKFPELSSTYDYNKILEDIIKRDETDSNRKISPLKKPDDAYEIDSSYLSIDEVVNKLYSIVKKYEKKRNKGIPEYRKMHFFYGSVIFLTRLFFRLFYRLKVYGLKNFIKGPALIVSNHVSYYDPPAIGSSCLEEVHYLARDFLFEKPILKTIIQKLNTHPLSGNATDIGTFKQVFKILKSGEKIILFPEGERSFDGNITKIMPGTGLFVHMVKCPIIPVYVHGAYEAWNRSRRFPKIFGKISVVFGSPINCYDIDHLEKKEFMKMIDERIEKALKDLKRWCDEGFQGSPP